MTHACPLRVRPLGWLVPWALLAAPAAAFADSGDVFDGFLTSVLGQVECAGYAGVVWVDVDGINNGATYGIYETQVVVQTITGEAWVEYEWGTPPTKWYFFSFIDVHCGGSPPYTGRGRLKIHFIDMLAPGFVWNNSSTWTYKRIPSLTIYATHDYCTNGSANPYQLVQAYRNLNQTDPIAGTSNPSGSWTRYDFSDATGIKELYVSTDYCENTLDDLFLRTSAQHPATGDFDNDGDIDLADFTTFLACFNGPARPPAQANCVEPDFDNDNDVDLTDFTVFLSCFNGPNRPPATGCPS